MEGGSSNGFGVTLENGMSTTGGDSMTLVSGGRIWRLRVPSIQESSDNILILEVKHGITWYPAQQFVVTL
ncbi:EsV-1-95 [Ectocarpus siliculosus virus 1]|uniref:EsV-1-95 n=1 Tax=Ectocarpus siliculosus virus 1 (isolate New Zealand/Kaikoura/1988) TaxID=654926 RepID=Q8QNI2_ESV1K|nr:EsV-1-95 [Ectocarpus siliculosus virus 1]AAK14513.1 EsV-1-95 [Ectocarpus siliculosus virus 1]